MSDNDNVIPRGAHTEQLIVARFDRGWECKRYYRKRNRVIVGTMQMTMFDETHSLTLKEILDKFGFQSLASDNDNGWLGSSESIRWMERKVG